MVATGDSITVAYDAAGYGSYPQYSWATGTSSTVSSHLLRLRAATGVNVSGVNAAVVGASSSGLSSQITSAVSAQADYLTIEIGANDACTSTVAGMTSVTDFDTRIKAALQQFSSQRPDADIFVASIPNLYRMWSISKDKFGARFIWATAGICQSMLASPTSTSTTDEARRLTVQGRVDDYNDALAAACAATARCSFDDYAVATYPFQSTHISTSDYFHPSVEGQRVLAEITWPHTPYAGG